MKELSCDKDMLELLSAGIISLWLNMIGVDPPIVKPQEDIDIVSLLIKPLDFKGQAVVQRYLKRLTAKGFEPSDQGVWVQSGDRILATNEGDKLLSAASLTKVATSLVAIKNLGPEHRFFTQVGATGPIRNGVLQGDLVIQGGGDPLFVWEEAISLGNTLNRLGIKQVTGNLVISGNFAMNYETDPIVAGELLRQALNATRWSGEVQQQYSTLPPGTPKPNVVIAGTVAPATFLATPPTALVSHQSLRLFELLKQMNIYSNNEMAEMLANSLGGGPAVAQQAATLAEVPPAEIQLINGSGLSPENRMSPRAVSGLFQALQRELQPHKLTIADLFPVAGRDRGTIELRSLPQAAVVKTGTLWNVSALAGAIPTTKYGPVWFVIMNQGADLDGLRNQQDQLLQALTKQWGTAQLLPQEFQYLPSTARLGEPTRNQILWTPPTPAS